MLGLKEVNYPLLRPANADLNMTLGMALFFMGWWVLWTIQEVGVLGFLKSTFAPKGGLKGALWFALLPLFLFVGVIEMVSIAIRPVSLSFRLFGNIYAGETLLHTMGSIGAALPPPLNWISLILFPSHSTFWSSWSACCRHSFLPCSVLFTLSSLPPYTNKTGRLLVIP